MLAEKISKEMKRKIFELTLAVYRVTDFFPKDEILKKQIREKANEVFGLLTEYNKAAENKWGLYKICAKVQAVKGYLALSRHNRFVKPINLAVLEREYSFLESFLERELDFWGDAANDSIFSQSRPIKTPKTTEIERDVIFHQKVSLENGQNGSGYNLNGGTREAPEAKKNISQASLNERQGKILDHIQNGNGVKISDLAGIFQNVSSKTIQRDLTDLVIKKVLKREGEKRWTTYSLVG